jgi:ABC-type phosphate/phosphonate transport system substrate-binding protein
MRALFTTTRRRGQDAQPPAAIAIAADLRGRTLALGSRDSGHAAILPLHFLASEGPQGSKDFATLRFDSDVGKHGDTGRRETEVLRALLDGRADAGAVGSPYWQTVQSEGLVPKDSLVEIWTSPPFNHCMFTARADLDPARARQFAKALRHDLRQSWRPRACADGCRRGLPAMSRCGKRATAACSRGSASGCRAQRG